jgi:ATP:ADP antiporter, AAA family
MSGLFKRFVDLREGEGRPAMEAFLALFAFVAGHTILETARDALFLTKLHADRLTLVYAILAVLAFLTSALNTRFVMRFGRRNALIFTLMIAAYGTTVIYFEPKTPGVVFVLYVWSALLGTIINVQYWMFAAQLFTIAQGKRLFAPITSGGVLGAVSGASIAALSLRAVPIEGLLLVGAGFFVTSAIILTSVRTDEARPPIAAISAVRVTPAKALEGGIVRFFREQPYLRRVAYLIALSTGAVLATDYLFKSVAAQLGSGEELGRFFARYYAVLNAIALIVQVGVASRVLRRQGVLFAVLVLPVLLFSGSVGVAAIGGLIALVLATKGADGALRHSLHRVSSELLWMPVPADARDRGKALIDGVLSRAMQAFTAGVILVLSVLGWSSPRTLAILVLVLASGWIVSAISLRRPYLDLFRQALRKGTLDLDSTPDELDLNSVEAVLEILSSRDSQRVRAAMDLLVEKKRSRLIPGLILYHESEEVLIPAIQILCTDSTRDSWIPLCERLLSDPRPKVRVAAVYALGRRGLVEAIERALQDPDPGVRARAAFMHHYAKKDGSPPSDDPEIKKLLALQGAELRAVELALLDAVHELGDARWADFILEMTASKDRDVVERAAIAMARVQDERFIPRLIERLDLRDGRGAIRNALVALGEPALEALEKALFDRNVDPRVRLHVPRTISKFVTQRAVDILTKNLVEEPSGAVRYKTLRGLGHLMRAGKLSIDRARIEVELLKNLIEHLRMLAISVPLSREMSSVSPEARSSASLLLGLLQDKAEQALERAFRLLQMAHPNEDLRSVYLALQSSDRRVRSHAQEFLDVLATSRAGSTAHDEDKRELMRIIADDLPVADRVSRAERFLTAIPRTYAEALALLVRENDEYVASLAAYHAIESGTEAVKQDALAVYKTRPSLFAIGWLGEAFAPRAAEAVGG